MEPLNQYGETYTLEEFQELGLLAGDYAPPQTRLAARLGVTRQRASVLYRKLAGKGYLEKRGARYLIVTYGSLEKNNEDRHV